MADAGGRHWTGDISHCVVDGKPGGDGATGGVDVEIDGLLWSVGFEEEQLGHNGCRNTFIDGTVQADDAFLKGRSTPDAW